jgi:mannose-6-phosphate isomerase-like protein (cupin superfamily)
MTAISKSGSPPNRRLGPQVPHQQRDELYIVAAGTADQRVEVTVTAVGRGDFPSLPRMWRTAS